MDIFVSIAAYGTDDEDYIIVVNALEDGLSQTKIPDGINLYIGYKKREAISQSDFEQIEIRCSTDRLDRTPFLEEIKNLVKSLGKRPMVFYPARSSRF